MTLDTNNNPPKPQSDEKALLELIADTEKRMIAMEKRLESDFYEILTDVIEEKTHNQDDRPVAKEDYFELRQMVAGAWENRYGAFEALAAEHKDWPSKAEAYAKERWNEIQQGFEKDPTMLLNVINKEMGERENEIKAKTEEYLAKALSLTPKRDEEEAARSSARTRAEEDVRSQVLQDYTNEMYTKLYEDEAVPTVGGDILIDKLKDDLLSELVDRRKEHLAELRAGRKPDDRLQDWLDDQKKIAEETLLEHDGTDLKALEPSKNVKVSIWRGSTFSSEPVKHVSEHAVYLKLVGSRNDDMTNHYFAIPISTLREKGIDVEKIEKGGTIPKPERGHSKKH